MGTEEQWAQRNSGHRGTVGTEEQWAQRNSRHRGTVGTEEQWAQRNSGHRGTVGTEEQWAHRISGHKGTLGTELCRQSIQACCRYYLLILTALVKNLTNEIPTRSLTDLDLCICFIED